MRYVREQGKNHVNRTRRLEANTHVDAVIETQHLLVFIEVKFTSGISPQTTFDAKRNLKGHFRPLSSNEYDRRARDIVAKKEN